MSRLGGTVHKLASDGTASKTASSVEFSKMDPKYMME